jgi:hypothetical protein
VDFDCILSETLIVQGITVFGEIDVLEGTDNKADVLREDGCVTGEACRLPRRVGGVENL